MRRRGPAHALAHITGIVQPIAQARVGFELRPVGHVDGARGDVIDGGIPVVARAWRGRAEWRRQRADRPPARASGFRRRAGDRRPGRGGETGRRRGGAGGRCDGGPGCDGGRRRQPQPEQLLEKVAIVGRSGGANGRAVRWAQMALRRRAPRTRAGEAAARARSRRFRGPAPAEGDRLGWRARGGLGRKGVEARQRERRRNRVEARERRRTSSRRALLHFRKETRVDDNFAVRLRGGLRGRACRAAPNAPTGD